MRSLLLPCETGWAWRLSKTLLLSPLYSTRSPALVFHSFRGSESDRDVVQSAEVFRLLDSSRVYDVLGLYVRLEVFRFEFSDLVPFGHDDRTVRSLESRVSILRVVDLVQEPFLGVRYGHGVVGDDSRSFVLELVDYSYR